MSSYRPENGTSSELKYEGVTHYQEMVGVFMWEVDLVWFPWHPGRSHTNCAHQTSTHLLSDAEDQSKAFSSGLP